MVAGLAQLNGGSLSPTSAPKNQKGKGYNPAHLYKYWDSQNDFGAKALIGAPGVLSLIGMSLSSPGRSTIGDVGYYTDTDGIHISNGYEFKRPANRVASNPQNGYDSTRKDFGNYPAENAHTKEYVISWDEYNDAMKQFGTTVK